MIDAERMKEIRADFPALFNMRNGKMPVYFDNACTTLTPNLVIAAMQEYYLSFPGCGGRRSRHWFADEVFSRIEGDSRNAVTGSRALFKDFINAKDESEIVFTQNTTHSINIVALGYCFNPGDTVVLTDVEHNSNLLPWQRLQKNGVIDIQFTESDEEGAFDLEKFKRILAENRVRLVSAAYTSNLTGHTVPAKEIVQIAHQYGARVLLDAAQTAPYQTIDVQDLDVDFLAFSVHKMCGPRGVGILYGKRELLDGRIHEESGNRDVLEPPFLGGGSVGNATYDDYDLLDPPECYETGIQNYPGQIAAGKAVEYIENIGLDTIYAHVSELNRYLTE